MRIVNYTSFSTRFFEGVVTWMCERFDYSYTDIDAAYFGCDGRELQTERFLNGSRNIFISFHDEVESYGDANNRHTKTAIREPLEILVFRVAEEDLRLKEINVRTSNFPLDCVKHLRKNQIKLIGTWAALGTLEAIAR